MDSQLKLDCFNNLMNDSKALNECKITYVRYLSVREVALTDCQKSYFY
jgi:hypothetical protein